MNDFLPSSQSWMSMHIWTLASLLISFISYSQLPAQSSWKEIGPLSSPIIAMGYDGHTILYAASQYGIYRSSDNGDSWELWERHEGGELGVGKTLGIGHNGFVTVSGVVYTLSYEREEDGFSTEPPSLIATSSVPGLGYLCLSDCLGYTSVRDFIQSGNRLFVAAGGSVWYKDVSASNWNRSSVSSYQLFNDNGNIISCGTGGLTSISTDNGVSWQAYSGGNLPAPASGFARKGTRLFASVPAFGIFVSKNGGSWVLINNGLPSVDCVDIINHGNVIYVATSDAWVWKTSNNGKNWRQAGSVAGGRSISALFSLNGSLFATGANGISRKSPGSDAWKHTTKGLASGEIDWIAARNDEIIAGKRIGDFAEGSPFYEGWLYRSKNPWRNWSSQNLEASWGMTEIVQQEDLVLTYTRGDDYRDIFSELYTDYIDGSGPDYIFDFCYDDDEICQYGYYIQSVAAIGNHLFIVASDFSSPSSANQLGISATLGANDDTQPSFIFSTNFTQHINQLRVDGGTLIACSNDGIYTSSDTGQSFQAAGLQGIKVQDVTEGNDFWLASTDQGLYRAWKSTPGNWQDLFEPNPGNYIIWAKKVLYSISSSSDLLYSLDKGNNWHSLPLHPEMPDLNPYSLAAEGNDFLFVGTKGRGIWRHPLLKPSVNRLAAPKTYSLNTYPNPNSGFLTIEAEHSGTLEILSLSGNMLRSYPFQAPSQKLDLRSLTRGLYFLRLQTANTSEIVKISKE